MNSQPKKSTPSLADLGEVLDCYESAAALPPTERETYLEELRQTSQELADEVESLLTSLPKVSQFLEIPPSLPLEFFSAKEAPAHRQLAPKESFGPFVIEAKIGEGGFSTVYRARHSQLERTIALKVFTAQAREARNLAQIDHESVVRVYSEGKDATTQLCWVEMQLIPGLSLADIIDTLKSGKLSGNAILRTIEERSVNTAPLDPTALAYRNQFAALNPLTAPISLVHQLAKALAHSHSRGILHLDVKPSNILIDPYGRPYLTDFNISLDRDWKQEDSLKVFGGTADYMPPEQQSVFTATDKLTAVKEVDESSDVYSLGIVLKECLMNMTPDRVLCGIVERAIAKNRSNRTHSAALLARELDGYLKLIEFNPFWRSTPFSRHPLITLTLAGAIPQIISSVIGTTYNQLRVISTLTTEQQEYFQFLNQSATPGIFVGASVLWFLLCARLNRRLSLAFTAKLTPSETDTVRRKINALPWWGMVFTTVSWVLCSVIFPGFIALKTERLQSHTLFHFGVSFLLSWLISLSFTFLLHQFTLLRLLYPRLFHPASSLSQIARSELRHHLSAMRVAVLLTLLVPNAGAVLLLAGDMSGAVDLLRVLLLTLLIAGVFGSLGAAALGLKISRTLAQLMK